MMLVLSFRTKWNCDLGFCFGKIDENILMFLRILGKHFLVFLTCGCVFIVGFELLCKLVLCRRVLR
jgi:hypothetical protein